MRIVVDADRQTMVVPDAVTSAYGQNQAALVHSLGGRFHLFKGDPMVKLFVSHASKDESVARRLVAALESKQLDCWIACRDVSKGGKYPGEIVREIKASRAVVVLLSKSAFESHNVLQEVSLANENKVMLMPICLDAHPVPDEFSYFLTLSQWIKEPDDSNGELLLETAVREICEAVRVRPSPPALSGATSAVPVVKVDGEIEGVESDTEAGRERSAHLSNEVATLAIETRRLQQVVANLEAQVAQTRELDAQLSKEETGLRDSLASVRERRKRLGEKLESLLNAYAKENVALRSLRRRYGTAAQQLRRPETTFGSGKFMMAEAARLAFLSEGNLPALRVETARAIAFPVAPYPPTFVDVFGFLATAFGLPGARTFWESVSRAQVLEPLQRYNKALSLLFDPTGSDSIQAAIGELEVLLRDPACAQYDQGIAACIRLPALRSKRDPCRLQIWKPVSDAGSSRKLLGFVAGAIRALRRSHSNGAMARDWRPALLSEVPF